MRYVPQLKRNLISVGALKALSLAISIRDGILKIIKGSMVVLKGVRHNNFYYLKGNTVTRQVATSTNCRWKNAEDELSPFFLSPLDLLEGVLPFGFFFLKQL